MLYFLTRRPRVSTAKQIQQYIQKVPRGQPFTSLKLMRYGKRTAVDQTLYRLAASKKITRIVSGVYVRPAFNKYVGAVLPKPSEIIKAIATKTNETIQVSGAEAALQLGLTTQVPAKPVFLTTGISRKFKIGALEITLKHVSPKKIPLTNSKAGLAITALWYLGKDEVTIETIKKIEQKLAPKEFKLFLTARQHMSTWMSDVIIKYLEE